MIGQALRGHHVHFDQRVRLDLREAVLHVIGVHRLDLLPRRRAQHLDDLDQLVDARLAREKRLPEHELCHHAARRPDVCVRQLRAARGTHRCSSCSWSRRR